MENEREYTNGLCHMTYMAAMPIYGKSLKIFFSGIKKPMTLKVGMKHRLLEYYQVCSNDDPGLTLTYLRQVKFGPLCFCMGKKVKTIDFSETIVVL